MFACLHGSGNLTALAFEFSPAGGADRARHASRSTPPASTASSDSRRTSPPPSPAAPPRWGSRPIIALAANPDAAICAARGFSGVSIVPQGDEAKFLAPCRSRCSRLRPNCRRRSSAGASAASTIWPRCRPSASPSGSAPKGCACANWRAAKRERKLRPARRSAAFRRRDRAGISGRTAGAARLPAGAPAERPGDAPGHARARHRRTAPPAEAGRSSGTHERTLRLPVPSLDTKAFLKLLQLDLAAHPPAAPVVHVWMAVNPVKPQAAQTGLFIPAAPEPVKLELTLARIKALVGRGACRLAGAAGYAPPGCISDAAFGPVSRRQARAPRATMLASAISGPPLRRRVTLDAGAARLTSPPTASAARSSTWPAPGAPPATGGPPTPGTATNGTSRSRDGALYRLYCAHPRRLVRRREL